jgi:hypothetical protein
MYLAQNEHMASRTLNPNIESLAIWIAYLRLPIVFCIALTISGLAEPSYMAAVRELHI